MDISESVWQSKGYIVPHALLLSFPKAYHLLGGHALSWNHKIIQPPFGGTVTLPF